MAKPKTDASTPREARVLVVDDEHDIAQMVSAYISGAG